MSRPPLLVAGIALAALLGVANLLALGTIGTPAAPPVAVVVIGAVLAAVTLAGVWPAWNGRRGGAVAIVASRLLSAALSVPAFLTGDVPQWALAIAIGSMVLDLVAAGLVAAGARRRAVVG
jgi:hypothetical protein